MRLRLYPMTRRYLFCRKRFNTAGVVALYQNATQAVDDLLDGGFSNRTIFIDA